MECSFLTSCQNWESSSFLSFSNEYEDNNEKIEKSRITEIWRIKILWTWKMRSSKGYNRSQLSEELIEWAWLSNKQGNKMTRKRNFFLDFHPDETFWSLLKDSTVSIGKTFYSVISFEMIRHNMLFNTSSWMTGVWSRSFAVVLYFELELEWMIWKRSSFSCTSVNALFRSMENFHCRISIQRSSLLLFFFDH